MARMTFSEAGAKVGGMIQAALASELAVIKPCARCGRELDGRRRKIHRGRYWCWGCDSESWVAPEQAELGI